MATMDMLSQLPQVVGMQMWMELAEDLHGVPVVKLWWQRLTIPIKATITHKDLMWIVDTTDHLNNISIVLINHSHRLTLTMNINSDKITKWVQGLLLLALISNNTHMGIKCTRLQIWDHRVHLGKAGIWGMEAMKACPSNHKCMLLHL